MPGFRPLRCLLLPIIAASLLPVGAEAAPSLAQAIKQADAKYLKLKDLDAKPATPNIEAGGFEEEEESKPTNREIALGSLKAALSYRQEGTGEEAMTIPVVTVFADGKQVAELKGEGTGTGDPPVSVQIAGINPANSTPEVVVSFYTGGAHCCSDTKVISASKDGASWKTIELGQFDGGPLLASDLAGDPRQRLPLRLWLLGLLHRASQDSRNRGWRRKKCERRAALPRRPRVLFQGHDHGGA